MFIGHARTYCFFIFKQIILDVHISSGKWDGVLVLRRFKKIDTIAVMVS